MTGFAEEKFKGCLVKIICAAHERMLHGIPVGDSRIREFNIANLSRYGDLHQRGKARIQF